jgi:hypothetical protein
VRDGEEPEGRVDAEGIDDEGGGVVRVAEFKKGLDRGVVFGLETFTKEFFEACPIGAEGSCLVSGCKC